nr:putative reverse transcriptase domain-containing protein [Tanacetum cinerariifolium]
MIEVFIGGMPRSIERNVTASKPQTLEEAITIIQKLMNQDLALSSVRLVTSEEKRHYRNQLPKANNNAYGRAYMLRDKNAHQNLNVVTGIHVDPAKIKEVKNWASHTTPTEELCGAPILAIPYGNDDFVVYCYASLHGLGALLMQREKVIAYASRQLRPHEKNYTTHDLKLGVSIQSALGTQLDISTTYHPKTDGQSERTIQTLEDMLRACVIDFGKVWKKHLPLVEFSYNTNYHASIKEAPFEALYGRKTIQTLEDMLRACVIDFGKGWEKHLTLVEFSYNYSYHASIKVTQFKALYGRKCRSPVCWAEVADVQLTGPGIIHETFEKIVQIRQSLQATRDWQRNYANVRRKPLEFQVRDHVMLKVSPRKVAYKLELPEELSNVHSAFHISNLKKSLSDESLVILMKELRLDDKPTFMEEPVDVVDREVK